VTPSTTSLRHRASHSLRTGLLATLLAYALTCAATPVAHPALAASTLRIWYATDDPTEAPVVKSFASAFQASHAGTTVNLTTYALDDLNTKMQLALSSGNTPDLIYTTPRGPGLPTYVRAGKLLDLSGGAHTAGWASTLRPGLLASYNDLLSPSGSAGGHVYAAPYLIAAVGVLYNQAIFQRLHLQVPRSLADFASIAAKVKAAGLTPLGLGNADGWVGDDWYLTLVNSLTGPEALMPEQRLDPRFSFAGTPFSTAAQTLQTWATNRYFTPQFGGLDAQDSVTAFFDGKTAMQLVSSSENGQIVSLAAKSKVPVGLFAFPSADAHKAPLMPQSGYAGWAVPTAGHQPALAEAFITQMLSNATVPALLAHGLIPANRLTSAEIQRAPGFQGAYLRALATATPGVYLDGAPVPNLNATMEANVQLLLQKVEAPAFLTRSLQTVYTSKGLHASSTRTDGEF